MVIPVCTCVDLDSGEGYLLTLTFGLDKQIGAEHFSAPHIMSTHPPAMSTRSKTNKRKAADSEDELPSATQVRKQYIQRVSTV